MAIDDPVLGIEGSTPEDRTFGGSRFAAVREAVFANPYQPVWGSPSAPPMPRHEVSLRLALRGILPFDRPFGFYAATRRAVDSHLDLRWGPERRGFRRLVHTNGICLLGRWKIDRDTEYTGYFRRSSQGLVVARLSTCCNETRGGHRRSLGLIGRLYPTTDPENAEPLPTAHFVTQQDVGGETIDHLDEMVLCNAPDTTSWRRGRGLPTLLVAGLCSLLTDRKVTIRQLYQIAELGEPAGGATRSPRFLRLSVDRSQPVAADSGLDFRDEVMSRIYDPGDPIPRRTLVLRIEVADEGRTLGWLLWERRRIRDWREIGTITFEEAVASYNADFVLHFNHPPWRRNPDDPATVHRRATARD